MRKINRKKVRIKNQNKARYREMRNRERENISELILKSFFFMYIKYPKKSRKREKLSQSLKF